MSSCFRFSAAHGRAAVPQASAHSPCLNANAVFAGHQQFLTSDRHIARSSPLHGISAELGRSGDFAGAQLRASRRSCLAPPNVISPALDSMESATSSSDSDRSSAQTSSLPIFAPVTIQAIREPVLADMELMNANLHAIAASRGGPPMEAAAAQIFGAGGKKLRPMIVLLVARATANLAGLSDLTLEQRRFAEIIEMIHTASLVHDDVLDESNTRRGAPTVNAKFGTRTAVMLGDFFFAESSNMLAELANHEVILLISRVIADFARGEIKQMTALFDTDVTMSDYIDKSFYKTASLIAASCRGAAAYGGMGTEVKEAMYEYGRHLGLAFQVVDDILDFTQTSEQLGKPQGQDLASGNLTAPALYALAGAHGPELLALIESEFTAEGGLPRAIHLVNAGGGITSARALARREADLALESLSCLQDCDSKRSLVMMVEYVLDRLY